MSAFLTPLILQDEGGFPMTLYTPLVYQSDLLKRTLTIPANFATDLASIPRGLWNVLPKVGKQDRACVVHDFLYQHNGVTKAQADAVLNEAMAVCGVSAWQRWIIYAGVVVGGSKTWNAYRRQAAV